MAKQWTRNYDNFFSHCFGLTHCSSRSLDGIPVESIPCFRTHSGYWSAPEFKDGPNWSATRAALFIPIPDSYSSTNVANMGSTSIAIGTGSATPSYDDYQLESPLTSNLTLGTVSYSWTYNEDEHVYTKTYKCPIAYSGENDITVSEFGIYVGVPHNYTAMLIYRETLDTPVTLSQNDTIEITFSQSIAQPNYTPYPTE